MKRLLVMAYFYPPLAGGGVHRVLSFTQYLPQQGWACTVVCAGEHDYWVRDESLAARVPAGTEILRVPGGSGLATLLRMRRAAHTSGRRSTAGFALLRPLADLFLQPDSYIGWAGKAREVAARRIAQGGIDAILSSSPPDSVHLAAAPLARANGLPWVADFRDPWIGLSFKKPITPWHGARLRAQESGVLANADLVLAASQTHHDELAARRDAPRRLLFLPNGYEPAARVPEMPATHEPRFRIVFTGMLSLMEDAGTLLEAVRDLAAQDPAVCRDLRVEIAGPYDDEWPRRVAALGIADLVQLSGPLPHAETRALQLSADVLILWKPRGEGFRTMVPGKTYEYLDSGRPIVALLPAGDEAGALVTRAGHVQLAPGDRAGLVRTLAGKLERWRAGERAVSARPVWLDERRRDRLAAQLAGALDTLPPAGTRA
ncbi:MAG: glycosyltransferase [Candidatus Eisenbacteria bacterium]|nr:glycosyltransferase [Candidatus Eisenbacteria bacterium]